MCECATDMHPPSKPIHHLNITATHRASNGVVKGREEGLGGGALGHRHVHAVDALNIALVQHSNTVLPPHPLPHHRLPELGMLWRASDIFIR